MANLPMSPVLCTGCAKPSVRDTDEIPWETGRRGAILEENPMYRSLWFLCAVIATLSLPAGASARTPDALRGAKLRSATGTLTITETRCPAGSTNCGKTKLEETFKAVKPRTRASEGRPGFSTGVQIVGQGTGSCSAESPVTTVTAADGSLQIISAARTIPGKFDSTRVVASSTRRGVRIAWLEPLAPAIACDYFGEPDTVLALPAAQRLPSALISPLIRPRALKSSRFSVLIGGSREWNDAAADGTPIAGRASWRLTLKYTR